MDSNGAARGLCHIVVLQHKFVAQQMLLGRQWRALLFLLFAGALITGICSMSVSNSNAICLQ